MNTFYSQSLQKNVRQINKKAARKMWNDNKVIYFHPSNMMFDNVWQTPCPVHKTGVYPDFDIACNDYAYYNCDNERGKYIHFFVTE